MDAPLLDEGALGVGDKLVHERPEAEGKNLGNDFRDGMDEAYGSIIGDLLSTLFFGEKHNIRGV